MNPVFRDVDFLGDRSVQIHLRANIQIRVDDLMNLMRFGIGYLLVLFEVSLPIVVHEGSESQGVIPRSCVF